MRSETDSRREREMGYGVETRSHFALRASHNVKFRKGLTRAWKRLEMVNEEEDRDGDGDAEEECAEKQKQSHHQFIRRLTAGSINFLSLFAQPPWRRLPSDRLRF